ncbi:MAG: hypothetical protein EBZ48_09830, partial [Proteobacteria bacterium]|nr:hypothetical protein [Pseudomonadota bacterium]
GLSNPEVALGDVLSAFKMIVFQMVVLGVGSFAVLGLVAELAQVGFITEVAVLAPKSERLNPVSGMQRLGRSFVQSWEPLLRVLLILIAGGIATGTMLVCLSQASWSQVATVVGQAEQGLLSLAHWLLAACAVGAAFDYFRRRREFYRELSMDHQEMREEHKELEGEPMVKALRKAMHESVAMQDIERRVRSAKVIVVRKAGTE